MITMYMNNTGGLNLTDSPLFMQDTQATGQSYNYDYQKIGSISKILAAGVLNTIADSQLKTIGLGVHHDVDTNVRTAIRCAGTKIQTFDPSTGTIVNQMADDTAAGTDFLVSTTKQPVVFTPFNTSTGGTQLWMAGGGLTSVSGYTGSKITVNGTPVPTGVVATSITHSDGGTFAANGVYYYGVQYRKTSTKALSNVALDVLATITAGTDSVTLDLTGITNIDATKYDEIIVWRSVVAGVSLFTTGSTIAVLAANATTYKDLGTSIADSQNTPRPGNTILDNSVLPTDTYNSLTAFKRRLVTCFNSTLCISDLNKPESWPLVNRIVVPSGGPIIALGYIGVPSEYTTGADEYLCIWKETELWVFTGTSTSDWQLLFVDRTGTAGQSLVVSFNTFVTWMGYGGIYIWDGKGRPKRVSRPIAAIFESDGDLDKPNLAQGYGCHYEKGNQVIWRVPHRTKGLNKLSIKLDTRLTAQNISQNLNAPEMDGVFLFDTDSNSYYAICSFRPLTYEEQILVGDDAGFVYQMFNSSGNVVLFDYETKPLDMGAPHVVKNYKRVIAYIEKLTVNDLTLYYWNDYRIRDEYKSKVQVSMEPSKGTQPALWDIALWDQAYWDDYTPDISPVEFNIHSMENNAVGLSLKLRFEQLEASAPVRIHGFAIEWEPMSNLPKPTQQVT